MSSSVNVMKSKEQFNCDPLVAGVVFFLPIITVFQFPVHDLTNDGSGHQAEQLQRAEDG